MISVWNRLKIYGIRFISRLINLLITGRYPKGTQIYTNQGIRCLIYNDKPTCNNLYINFHGGGFVGGYPEDDGLFCDYAAKKLDCTVISCTYRFAPEYPCPAGIEDCLNTIRWAQSYFKPEKVIVGGFSAGGTFAISATNAINAETPNSIHGLVSFYAPIDLSENSVNDFDCKDPFRRNLFHHAYLWKIKEQRKDMLLKTPNVSPAFVMMENLPDMTLIVAAENDPNHSDIKKLGQKIEQSKAHGIYKEFPGTFHGWTHIPEFISKDLKRSKWEAFDLVIKQSKLIFQ